MARYRKVDPRLWDDERFVDFDDLKRSLWLLLLTGPAVEPIPGLQIGGIASLAETLRRPVEPLRERLGELLGERLVEVDERLRLIRLPNALKYNEPDNPNQVTGWFKAWQSLPESRLKYDHIESIRDACEASDNRKNDGKTAWLERFEKTFGTVRVTVTPTVTRTVTPTVGGSRARSEQEQEQEQEQMVSSSSPSATIDPPMLVLEPTSPPRTPKASSKTAVDVFEHWRSAHQPKAKQTPGRLKRINARLKDGFSPEDLIQAIDGALLDDWLMGRDPKARPEGWRDIDTILRDAAQVERLMGLQSSEAEDTCSEPIYPPDPPGTVYTDAPEGFWDACNEIGRL